MTATADTHAVEFRSRLRAGNPLSGLVVRTPSYQVLEVVAAAPTAAPDVVMIDTEHAAISLDQLDAMLAIAVAVGLPALVRVPALGRSALQLPLDMGATGVVVPHVDSVGAAREAVRWSYHGPDGRGYSGSTRAGRWGTSPMREVLARAAMTTTVVVQVEDPAGVEVIDGIVTVEGVDAVFLGVADLTVALGATAATDVAVTAAVDRVLTACAGARMPVAVFAGSSSEEAAWRVRGASLVLAGTDQARLRDR